MSPLSALLIDDEPPARAELRRLLSAHPEITVVGEAGTVQTARARLETPGYQLVFLDIQLIGGNGFDLVPHVRPEARVIFVSSLDRFSLRAFEVNALDYLLKPVMPARLAASLQRLRGGGQDPAALPAVAAEDLICLKTDAGDRFVPVARISAVLSDENYTHVHLVSGQRFLVRQTMKTWEDRLPAAKFARLHRQAIVQLDHVTNLRRDALHRPWLTVRGVSKELAASRRQWRELSDRLGPH